jgi:hypothetical protein
VRLYLLFVAGKKGLLGIVRGLIEGTTVITLNGTPRFIFVVLKVTARQSIAKAIEKGKPKNRVVAFFLNYECLLIRSIASHQKRQRRLKID